VKKLLCLLFSLSILLCGCFGNTEAEEKAATDAPSEATTETQRTQLEQRQETVVRILLPDEESLDWKNAGEDLQQQLELRFYQAELFYAGGSPVKQAQQLESAVADEVDILILAPVESAALTEVCKKAKEAGIPIISYDRLLMDTDAVTCYISFDYLAMGRSLGQEIVNREGLATLAEGEFRTIEFFMGSPEDNNTLLLHLGIMEVLEPYLHTGALVTPTGRIALEDICIVNWDASQVTRNLSDYRKEYYSGGVPDILCTVSDAFANACITQLGNLPREDYPTITGLGGTKDGLRQLKDGKLSVTISTDLIQLNDRVVQTVVQLLNNAEPEYNDTTTCHNNAMTVPAYLCDFALLTQSAD
jgi:putative multiple sugar transport system substrate-binding protein